MRAFDRPPTEFLHMTPGEKVLTVAYLAKRAEDGR